MELLPPFLRFRSFSLAMGILVVSAVLSLAFLPIFKGGETMAQTVYFLGTVASAFALMLCSLGWLNLIRDAEGGYGVVRSGLAALALLAATSCPMFTLMIAARHLLS